MRWEHVACFLNHIARVPCFFKKGHSSDPCFSQSQKSNRQDFDMPTQIAVSKQKRDNLEAVFRCAKADLFAKVKFIYDQKADLAVVGGEIYNDCKRKCKDKLGGQDLPAVARDTHVEGVWTDALTKHNQKNALAQKRSTVCTVMQSEFSGESAHSFSTATRFIRCH
jgi:hypothetical protein